MTLYDITTYADISQVINDTNYAKSKGLIIKKQDDLYIIKYNKNYLRGKNIYTLGLFRSVITDGKKLIAFSPPKSIPSTHFMERFPLGKNCLLEEFVEGTMINCFYHNQKWKITTRWNIGAKSAFYKNDCCILSFHDMFKEAMKECNLSFDKMDKKYSYSFVLQHPKNRIVVPFTKPHLVLISIYKLNGWCAEEQENMKIANCNISYPLRYSKESGPESSWQEAVKPFTNINTDYMILGVMLKHSSGVRSKIRNPIYEKVRALKGNSPKIQFQYYHLYQLGHIKEFIQYFPEHKNAFWQYRKELFEWTEELYSLYKECFIFKNIAIKDTPYPFRPHIWALHDIYLSRLREQKESITKKIVINYIYNIPPARLMYAINYPVRQKEKDDVKGIVQNSQNVN